MYKSLVSDLINLHHNITVDHSTLTASHLNNAYCSSKFNFHAQLDIENKTYPVIIQGHIGNIVSMSEDDYGEIIGYGINLRELIFKDQDFFKNASGIELSRLHTITQDILYKDEYYNLIVNHKGAAFSSFTINPH